MSGGFALGVLAGVALAFIVGTAFLWALDYSADAEHERRLAERARRITPPQ